MTLKPPAHGITPGTPSAHPFSTLELESVVTLACGSIASRQARRTIHVSLDLNLDSLGLDSLSMVELVMDIEKRLLAYGVNAKFDGKIFEDREGHPVTTVFDIYTVVGIELGLLQRPASRKKWEGRALDEVSLRHPDLQLATG